MCPPVANTLSTAWGISLLMRSLAKGRVAMSDRPTTTSVGTEILGNVAVSSNLNMASTPRASTVNIQLCNMKTSEVLGSLPLNPTYVAKFSSYSTSTPGDALRPIKQEKLSCPRVSLPVNPEISVVNSAAP